MGIIAGLKSGIKGFLGAVRPDWVIVAIIALAASAAFGLGFLAGRDEGRKEALVIEERPRAPHLPGQEAVSGGGPETAELPAITEGGQYVASKTGKSYHLPWCSGAKLIKEENKIWFASKAEAEARGYAPAGNCPGI